MNSSLPTLPSFLLPDSLPPRPKRPLTAYNIFFQEERRKMLEERKRTNDKKSIGFAPLTRTIAAKWKNTPAEERQAFEVLSRRDRERYDKQVKVWKHIKRDLDKAAKKKSKKQQGRPDAPNRTETTTDNSVTAANSLQSVGGDDHGQSVARVLTTMAPLATAFLGAPMPPLSPAAPVTPPAIDIPQATTNGDTTQSGFPKQARMQAPQNNVSLVDFFSNNRDSFEDTLDCENTSLAMEEFCTDAERQECDQTESQSLPEKNNIMIPTVSMDDIMGTPELQIDPIANASEDVSSMAIPTSSELECLKLDMGEELIHEFIEIFRT